MKIKIAIVVQGPSLYVEEVKNAWKDFKNDLIFSTWIGSENEYTENDIVIFNEEPLIKGHTNVNLQKISTYNGLLKAKELGYTHAIKIRSDYLPTNAKEFINILEIDKINVMNWHYTIFLWKEFPTLKGYIGDHLMFGQIDHMIDIWDMKDNFCSAQVLITWSYIEKLKIKKNIDIHYFLNDLNENNDLFYIKSAPNAEKFGFFNYTDRFGSRILQGRYESYFKTFRMNPDGTSEYTKSPKETEKYMNDNYLNFLKYFNPLPKITILNTTNKDLSEIIYPKDKLEIVEDENKITSEYIITSDKITSNSTVIIEYLKKINTFYDGTLLNYQYIDNNITWDNPGNFNNSGYKKGDENIGNSSILLTKKEFFNKI